MDEEGARHQPPYPLDDLVAWGYRLLLDREPDDPDVVARMRAAFPNSGTLRRAFFKSAEFAAKNPWAPAFVPRTDRRPMAIELDLDDEQLGALLAHTQKEWARLGAVEPHWSVLSTDEYRSERISQTRAAFEATGRGEIANNFRWMESNGIDLGGVTVAIEYGCGVGRVSRWLSERVETLHAFDISPTHLQEADAYLRRERIRNVQLHRVTDVQSLEGLPRADLIYSIIVLQHNTPPIMAATLKHLLGALRSGGVALFQIPTYRAGYSFNYRDYASRVMMRDKDTPAIEVHVLPQRYIHQIVADAGCVPVEILEDTAAGPGFVSNTFLVRKSS